MGVKEESRRSGRERSTAGVRSIESLAPQNSRTALDDSGRATGVRLSVIASALFVPSTYVFGRSYIEAWVKAHDLPTEAFAISIEEALLGAYWGFVQGAARIMKLVLPDVDLILVLFLSGLALFFLIAYVWMLLSATLLGLMAKSWRHITKATYRRLSASKISLLRQRVLPAFMTGYLLASIPVVVMGCAAYLLMLSIVPAWAGERIGTLEGRQAKRELMVELASGRFGQGRQFAYFAEQEGRGVACVVKCGDHGCGLMLIDGAEFVSWDGIKRISPKAN